MMKMFNIPNLITALNMLCGVFAVLLAIAGRIDIAPLFIFLGAVLDFLDGFLARILKQQSELGKQLDSLADIITFGLAPGIIMMVMQQRIFPFLVSLFRSFPFSVWLILILIRVNRIHLLVFQRQQIRFSLWLFHYC